MENHALRIGKVSSINYQKGTARVTYEDRGKDTTVEFPFLAVEYLMPKVGDQVLVAHLSSGSQAGVILGPVWHDGKRPPASGADVYHKELGHTVGKGSLDYRDNGDTLTIKAGRILINVCDGGVLIDLYAKLVNLEQRIQWLEGRIW